MIMQITGYIVTPVQFNAINNFNDRHPNHLRITCATTGGNLRVLPKNVIDDMLIDPYWSTHYDFMTGFLANKTVSVVTFDFPETIF